MSVTPATVLFRLFQGATFSEPVTLYDANSALIDLTGYSARLQARRDITDATAVFTLSSTDGSIVLGGAAGTITLKLTAATTAAMTIDYDGEFWVHDLLLTAPDTSVQRTYQGVIIASPAVTR